MSARAWLRAARLPAQANIALPLVVGQSIAVMGGARFSLEHAVWIFAFGLFDQLFIVFSNDVADEATDRDNRTFTPFSGGSRVLVDGSISQRELRRAALAMGSLTVGAALALSRTHGSVVPLALGVGALALLWIYSFAPLRLSYRGGGEIAQVAGTGVILPLFGYVGQMGSLHAFPWPLLLVLVPMRVALAIATALPDEPSDRASKKRSLPAMIGGVASGAVMAALAGCSIVLASRAVPTVATPLLAGPAAVALAALLLGWAKPGTRAMNARVFLAIAAGLTFESGLAWTWFHA